MRWIVVVTRVDARIFTDRPFRKVSELRNQLGRAKNREMTTGKPGFARSKFAMSKGVHAMSRDKKPHEEAAIAFAKRLAKYLRGAKNKDRFDSLTLVAEAKMLGRVRKELDKQVRAATRSMKMDLGRLNPTEIRGVLGL